METVEPKKNSWIEIAVVAAAVAFLFYSVELEKILAGLTTVVGLGFVIFWHELGHFLAAKWAGVKVIRFSVGFPLPGVPPIFAYRKGMGLSLLSSRNKEYEAMAKAAEEGRPAPGFEKIGETEYVFAVLPLGGYVRMLGEEPGESEGRPTDPRAFINKPVGARIMILSAGVLMNVLLGVLCYTALFLHGTSLIAPRIGFISTGSAAYMAGLKPGDEVVAIDGRRDIDWEDILNAAAFSWSDQIVHFEVKRPGLAEPFGVDLRPVRKPHDDAPKIGVGSSESLTLIPKTPFLAPPGLQGKLIGQFEGDDVVTAVGPEGSSPEPVASAEELHRILTRFADKPLVFVVRRTPKPKKDAAADSLPPAPIEVKVTVPPVLLFGLGARMTIEPISVIRPGSIAEKAGFQVGDTILKVDGRDFDPLRLPRYCFDHAGQPIRFEVGRAVSGGRVESKTIVATPDDTAPRSEGTGAYEPLDVSGLGLAYAVSDRIASIEPGSPAAKAGWKPGAVVESLGLSIPVTKDDGKPTGKTKSTTITLDPKEPRWSFVFGQLQNIPPAAIKVGFVGSKASSTITPEVIPGWYSADRGLAFDLVTRRLPPQSLGAALSRGSRKTWEKVLTMYAMLRGLVTRRLSHEGFGGIIPITDIAFKAALSGFESMVPFLAFLSINLAVLNFLPIPPLDGGQVLFLLLEKIRGRPVPEPAENFVKLAGVGLVLLLFVVVTFNDIMKYFVR